MSNFLKRSVAFLLTCGLLLGFLPAVAPVKAEAAAYEFYGDYSTVTNIKNYNSCTGMQGMALDDTYLYNVKINSSTEANAMITRTHKDTGETVRMTNAADGTQFFTYLSHANDLGYGDIAGVKTLFVTPSVAGSNSLIRYAINGTKLTKIGNYTAMLNGSQVPLSSAQVMRVDDDKVTLICKRNKYIYTGTIGVNQTSGTLELTQLCTLDVAHVTINGVVKDLSDYLHQGFGYHDNKIFVPITGSVDMSISIIAVYNIDGASGTIRNDPSLSFMVHSSTYATKFEIESCGICPSDGKLYFNTNRATSSSGDYDGVHYIKDYIYDPTQGDSSDSENYRWEMVDGKLVSVTKDGAAYNGIIQHFGSIDGETITGGRFYVNESINLYHDRPWIVEWKSSGKWTDGSLLFSSYDKSQYEGNTYFFRRKNSTLMALGQYSGGTFYNYGLDLASYGVDGTAEHVYRMVNKLNSDGTNMIYLWVDGKELGPMNNYYIAGTSQGTKSDWLSGKDFRFSYLGTDIHPLDTCDISYIQVWGNGLSDQRNAADSYRWETQSNALTAVQKVGTIPNAATLLTGSCSSGVYTDSQWSLNEQVVLLHDKPWSVEWKSEGAFTGGALLLAAAEQSKTTGAPFLFRNSNSLIAIGWYDGAQFNNYGLKLTDYGIDPAASHVYRLTNRIEADGSNMVYLYVDGLEIGALNQYFVGGSAKNTTSDYLNGKDLTFGYIGTYQHTVDDATINYLQVWENGIPSAKQPESYRWEAGANGLVDAETGEFVANDMLLCTGSVTNGAFSSVFAAMDKPITLLHDRAWSISWKSAGDWRDVSNGALLLASCTDANDAGNVYLYRRGTSDIIALGHRSGNKHHNYGVKLSDHGIDGTVSHVYTLENRVAADGSNMVYLLVDGVELGAMNGYYISGNYQNTKDNWVSGKDFVFSYLGTENFPVGGCTMEYLQVREGARPSAKVQFVDWDGEILSENTYYYGESVVIPAAPVRDADNIYTYQFAGWDKDVTVCDGDAVYTATYTRTYIDYTVTFLDWDGNVLQTGTYHYGDAIVAPSDPQRAEDGSYRYTFIGWDTSVGTCVGNAVFTAIYESEQILPPTIIPQYPTLEVEDEIRMNVYFSVENLNGISMEDMGLILWETPRADGTMENAQLVNAGAVYSADSGYYGVTTGPIAAKKLGDMVYFKVYIRLPNGSYVYSDLISYSPKQYALNVIGNAGYDSNLRSLMVAMLNYGAEAQTFFAYKPYDLMNKTLTESQLAMVQPYSDDMVSAVPRADADRVGAFAATDGFTKKQPTVSLEGAFAINYYFAPDRAVAGDMMFYYWTGDVYQSGVILSEENASGAMVMMPSEDGYLAVIDGIAAKSVDMAIYVAGVYTDEYGVRHSTGVLQYSLGLYCASQAAGGAEEMKPLAKATAVYGYYAKNCFHG